MTKTGADFLADVIDRQEGVDCVFFVDAVLRHTLMELEKRGVKRILAHSEKAAAYMADGYARVSGKTGFCMAQAVGAANLAAGLQDGYLDRVPLVALTGRKPDTHQHRNAYQEVRHAPLYEAVTKFTAEVRDVQVFPRLLGHALRMMKTGTRRPVHLDLDGLKGHLVEEAAFVGDVPERIANSGACDTPIAAQSALEAAKIRIAAAKKPMIVCGVDTLYADAGAGILKLAEALQAPVATAVGARSVIPTDHPNHFGVVGTYSAPYANKLMAEADLVIFIGCHMGDQVTCDWSIPSQDTPVIQIDADPAELGRAHPNVVGLAGALEKTSAALAAICTVRSNMAWRDRCVGAARDWLTRSIADARANKGLIPAPLLAREVGQALPENGVVVADTGFSAIWTAQYTEFAKEDQTYLRAAGSLGWAFPAAIGARLGSGNRPVVCFTGDGAFYYHIGELETLRRWNVPLVVVVNNNSALGQGLRSVKKLYEERDGNLGDLVEFHQVSFAEMAKVFDIRSFRVEKADDIRPTIEKAIALNRPVIVDVVTDPDSNPEPAWMP